MTPFLIIPFLSHQPIRQQLFTLLLMLDLQLALSNDIDNINLDQVNDVYGTSMDSAASSSYSFGLQSPPVVSSAPSTTSVYHPSPPLKNAIPKPEPATADISDIPTEPIVQKT
jgi:hypothetical protein